VLIAVPAVIVVLRVYPVLLRGLLRGSARGSGATVFLGLARAARTALTPALPAFALVLALSVAAFAGMVRDAVTRGEVAASWQTAGADVTIAASGQFNPSATISPAALHAAGTVPGVTHAAAVWQADWTPPGGQPLTGLAVDPASYAALVAATQTFPEAPARLLAAAAAGNAQPVLASPQAAAELGRGVTTLDTDAGVKPVRVRVAGVLSGTPALPAGGAFVVMPLAAIRPVSGPVQVNELLLTGAGIDSARLSAVVREMIPGGVTTFRSDILKGLSGAPLQHGTFVLFALAVVAAAALGLAVVLLELSLGSAEREATLARLATMGLGEGQRTRVVVLEVLPAVVAAAVAAWACALVLPRVIAPAVDLSVFTGSAAAVALAPDVASVALPLAGLFVVAVAGLAIEIRASRRRRVAASLRAGG
jgi:putative ABC transport system permease protein